jgi:hypothetical protein
MQNGTNCRAEFQVVLVPPKAICNFYARDGFNSL